MANSGELVGLFPVHPLAVSDVKWSGVDKKFSVLMSGGTTEDRYSGDMTQILGLSLDGLRGLSPLSSFRMGLQTAKAGDTAANRAFTTGATIAGMVTTEEDVDEDEAKVIKNSLNAKISGVENTGSIAFVNRQLKFSPWAMNNKDAEFIASRQFSIEEQARMAGGVPLSLLSVGGAVSNWGTGVAESFLGLQKFVLMPITSRIEQALKSILPPGQFAEFDFAGLLAGTPQIEIELLIKQVEAGLLTVDEARAYRNLPPLKAAAPATEGVS
jgi:HK97 family phage portal protein